MGRIIIKSHKDDCPLFEGRFPHRGDECKCFYIECSSCDEHMKMLREQFPGEYDDLEKE